MEAFVIDSCSHAPADRAAANCRQPKVNQIMISLCGSLIKALNPQCASVPGLVLSACIVRLHHQPNHLALLTIDRLLMAQQHSFTPTHSNLHQCFSWHLNLIQTSCTIYVSCAIHVSPGITFQRGRRSPAPNNHLQQRQHANRCTHVCECSKTSRHLNQPYICRTRLTGREPCQRHLQEYEPCLCPPPCRHATGDWATLPSPCPAPLRAWHLVQSTLQ